MVCMPVCVALIPCDKYIFLKLKIENGSIRLEINSEAQDSNSGVWNMEKVSHDITALLKEIQI